MRARTLKERLDEKEGARTRILVVEDNGTLGRVLAGTIRRLGCETTVVGTVREAKEHLSDLRVWAGVILDLFLADGNGIEVFKWLRGRDAEMPVLIHTGNPDHDSIHAAYDLGAEYLEKPTTTSQIERFLRRAEAMVLERGALASSGKPHESDALAQAWKDTYGLSDAGSDILARSTRGQTRATIAAERGVSLRTIDTQVVALLAKLGDASLRDAVERLLREVEQGQRVTETSRSRQPKS